MLYHISPTHGLKTLQPRVSTHGKAYVYAIETLVTGLLFGANCDDFDFIISTLDDGTPQVYECYAGALESVYRGKSCSVYEVKDDGFLRGMTGWSPELVSETAVTVQRETVIDDLYTRILSEAARGTVILRRFEDTSDYKARISAHIVDRLIRFDAMRAIDHDIRFQKHYKRIIDALRTITDGHLLD